MNTRPGRVDSAFLSTVNLTSIVQSPQVDKKGVVHPAGAHLSHCGDWVTLAFDAPRPVLSSAVLGGGLGRSRRWLNLRVNGDADDESAYEDPEVTLAGLCRRQGWGTDTVAMMTAASMDSLRVRHTSLGAGATLAVLVTTGTANARRAGDRAEYRTIGAMPAEIGTINLAVVASARLSDAALVESALVATEAKAAVLQDLGIRSPVSGAIATGTGTDSLAVFGGYGSQAVHYAGKHTLFGEMLARLVIAALDDSIHQCGALIADLDAGD